MKVLVKGEESVNLCRVPTRWVHFRIAEELHDKMRAAAEADRRSVSNWVALTVERALDREQSENEDARTAA